MFIVISSSNISFSLEQFSLEFVVITFFDLFSITWATVELEFSLFISSVGVLISICSTLLTTSSIFLLFILSLRIFLLLKFLSNKKLTKKLKIKINIKLIK